jgi:hypothetical protein
MQPKPAVKTWKMWVDVVSQPALLWLVTQSDTPLFLRLLWHQAGAAAPSAPQPSSGDEAASLSVQLSVVQAELSSSQQQVVELSQHLAAAEAARAAMQEQLEHLDVKVGLVLTHTHAVVCLTMS